MDERALRVLGGSVLGLEAVVVLLAIPAVIVTGWLNAPPAVFIAGGIALAVALIALIGALTRPRAIAVGWVLQGLVFACGLLVPAMFIIGAVFGLLWFYCLRLARRSGGADTLDA
jgi:hypothetical protein